MKDREKKEKEKSYEKFDKKLMNKINAASTAKNWSDLLPIMKDVLSLLIRNNEYDFNDLSDKKLLAKRLAQGLNPECPSGLHEVTLEVYEVILKNITINHQNKLMDNLYLYAYGLFPFFPNATIPNKKKFLETIVTPIFLKLNKDELKLCLPGLLSSLIPGLDDNNEQTTKLIYGAFDAFISINNGELERDFFGVYWMLLLRCQHLRSSGIKYLLEKIKKYEEFIKLDENKKKELIEKQYPNINKTVVNALCEIIKEKDIPTVRNGMDFIIFMLPLTQENNMIDDNAKINLIRSGLHLLINNEYSTIRRLKNWLLGTNSPDDEIILDSKDMKYKMNLVIEAFKVIFNPDKNLDENILLNNIKIIQRLFESQEEFINLILPDISYLILKCTVNYWQINLDMAENIEKNEIIDNIKKFFETNEIYYNCLWKSLANSISELSTEKEPNLFKRVCEILIPLRFSLIFFDIKSNDQRIKYYFPIIANLLNIIKRIPYKREDFKKIKQVILISLAFLKSLQETRFHEKKKDEENNDQESLMYEIYDKVEDENEKGSFNFNIRRASVLTEMSYEEDNKYEDENNLDAYNISDIFSLSSILNNKENIKLIEDLSDSIFKFQEYYINILKEYSKIDNQVTKFEILLFRQCAELIIRLQEYSQEKENQIPKWVKYLENIIFNTSYQNIILSIEAANILFDINLSSSLRNKIFLNIKKSFISEEIFSDIIEESSIQEILHRISIQPNCFELSLAKFYLLSNKQSNQTMIMELLLKLYLIDKKKFVEIINNTFNSDENFIENIKLFNNFWKLLNEFYPEEIFFEKGECIFNMVDLLDNKNPLLRHLSKAWLNQANQYYNKIINPILLIFLDTNIIFESKRDENITEYLREFETSKILDAFEKLKNVILNCQIIEFLKTKKPKMEYIFKIRFETFNKDNMFYLQTLISIALHYTRTKAMDKLNDKFKKEVFSVNAASCEFLEFLLNTIDDKQFLLDNNKIINDTILTLLNYSLTKNDEVMPSQLLDVLKALYFRCPLEIIRKPQNKSKFLNILNNKELIEILIKGMTNDHFYIREHFLLFTKKCIESFISIITIEDKKELQDFYDLCNRFIEPLSQLLLKRLLINNGEKEDTENYSHYDKKSNQLIFKNYCEEYKEYKSYDESDVLSILKSIKDIIKNCFKNEILDKSNKTGSDKNVKFLFIQIPFIKKKALRVKLDCSGDWGAFKKELVNSQKLDNPFISFLTTVIIDYTDKNPNKEISGMPSHLYENQISALLNSLLSIWINQSDRYEIYDYCLNNNGILAPKINDSKKNLSQDQINYVKDNIKNNPIKQYIIDIAMNLFITDSVKFIGNIMGLWCMDLCIREKFGINDKQYKLSIIELLISMDIPLDIILFCIGVELQNKIAFKKEIYKKVNKNYETPYDVSCYEAKIFHFIYSYLLLNPNKYTKKNENEIIEIWKELINIFNYWINGTKILYSYCWMYEILDLASTKFNIQFIDSNQIKTGIENIFNILTNKLIDAVFSDKLDSRYNKENQLVLPFLPHIYTNIVNFLYEDDNLYEKNIEGSTIKRNKNEKNDRIDINNKNNLALLLDNTKDDEIFDKRASAKRSKTIAINQNRLNNNLEVKLDEMSDHHISKFYDTYIDYAKSSSEYNKGQNPKQLASDSLNRFYQSLSFIILKENFYSLIKNLFNDNLNIAKKYYTDIINKLLNVIKNENKTEKKFKIHFANEFLVNLMENTHKNIVSCSKSQLMDYIKSPQLFNCSLRELHGRKNIIEKLRDNYPEILIDLIHDMNDKNIFVKKTDEEKKKILRRVSFVIYSCKKDVFSKDFGLIRSKSIELLSDYSDNNLLENEIFLIMRMLFLRFSHDGVMQMIRDLWPIIFTELIENILNKKRNKDFNLLLESFKFIELLSLVNIEEFSLYQWIFMLDTFDMNYLDIRKSDSLLKKLVLSQESLFRPLLLEYYKNDDITIDEKFLEGKKKGKSELYINAKNPETLMNQIKKLFYSIGDMNSYKVDANYAQIEESIEKDFLAKENIT